MDTLSELMAQVSEEDIRRLTAQFRASIAEKDEEKRREREPLPLPWPLDREVWRTIPGHPGYEVSSNARVRSHIGRNGKMRMEPVLMKVQLKKGYPFIKLKKGDRTRGHLVHRLVLAVFHRRPYRNEYELACHIDGDTSDSSINNLYWGTDRSNAADTKRHRRMREAELLDEKLSRSEI